MDALFLKKHIHAQAFQLSDGLKKRHCISGETGYTLRDNKINVSLAALFNHALKPDAFSFSAGHGFVTVDTAVQPAAVSLNHFTVVADLSGQ